MNTTDGNRGIVPTQPTKGTSIRLPNTTDGNRWIFKILPTVGCQQVGLEHPPTSVGGIWLGWASLCRSDFNNPPTAVGGIQLSILIAPDVAAQRRSRVRALAQPESDLLEQRR